MYAVSLNENMEEWNFPETPDKIYLRKLVILAGALKCVPSFQRFFYQKGQNTTFNQFLSKILTNKSTRKKIQLVEGTK